jgi:hypothetical protein
VATLNPTIINIYRVEIQTPHQMSSKDQVSRKSSLSGEQWGHAACWPASLADEASCDCSELSIRLMTITSFIIATLLHFRVLYSY